MATCIFCDLEVELENTYGKDICLYNCKRCGTVEMTNNLVADFDSYADCITKKNILSAITRYRTENKLPVITFFSSNILQALDSFFVPRNSSQQLDLLLKYLSRKSTYKGEIVDIDIVLDYPIAFCKNYNELEFFLKQLESQGQIEDVTEGYG